MKVVWWGAADRVALGHPWPSRQTDILSAIHGLRDNNVVMRQFYGINPLEYTFVNAAVRIGLSKTKGRKAFFAFRQIQEVGIESWKRDYSEETRGWQKRIIAEAGFQNIFDSPGC